MTGGEPPVEILRKKRFMVYSMFIFIPLPRKIARKLAVEARGSRTPRQARGICGVPRRVQQHDA